MKFIWSDRAELLLSKLTYFVLEIANKLRYFYDGWVHLLPDVDGVRLITSDVCELLQKVPGEYRSAEDI